MLMSSQKIAIGVVFGSLSLLVGCGSAARAPIVYVNPTYSYERTASESQFNSPQFRPDPNTVATAPADRK